MTPNQSVEATIVKTIQAMVACALTKETHEDELFIKHNGAEYVINITSQRR